MSLETSPIRLVAPGTGDEIDDAPSETGVSAEIRPVWTVVSWIASSMKRSWGCPLEVLVDDDAVDQERFSVGTAPEIIDRGARAGAAEARARAVLVTPGARSTASRSAVRMAAHSEASAVVRRDFGPRSGGASPAETVTDCETPAGRRT